MYGWLADRLPSATHFACQTGYYRFDAIEPFADDIARMLERGGRFDLVVGINEERLNARDLERTLDLVGGWIPNQVSFTVVGASNALFHPKTYYTEVSSGNRSAAVGSANLTRSGTGHHIEACLFLDENDDPRVITAVLESIVAWSAKAVSGAKEARLVTAALIDELAAERAIDPAPLMRQSRPNDAPSSVFPPLPPIPGIPNRQEVRRPSRTRPVGRLAGARIPFPAEMTGIVKRLSKTDVKGFEGRPGTPYIALPSNPTDLANRLPMRPSGMHDEPHLDCLIEARLDKALSSPVSSGTDPAGIKYIGMGTTQRSHRDLRLNIPRGIHERLLQIASPNRLETPQKGDMAAIEFLDEGGLLRVTFASHNPLKHTLSAYLSGSRSWGWLPAGVVPPW